MTQKAKLHKATNKKISCTRKKAYLTCCEQGCGEGLGAQHEKETLWHKTKGDTDYLTHGGNEEEVNTVRSQE